MLGAELWCGANYHVAREDCLVGFFGRLDNILGASVKIVVSSLWNTEYWTTVYVGRFIYVGSALVLDT